MVTTVRLGLEDQHESGAENGFDDKPVLVLGPALGFSAAALWSAAADLLSDHFRLVAWDLPGHGTDRTRPYPAAGVAGIADDVLAAIDDLGVEQFYFAGSSIGGAVGIQLLLDAPDRVLGAVLLGTGARFGPPGFWQHRLDTVRSGGTASLVGASAGQWFAADFAQREPERADELTRALAETTDEGYLAACEALASFDQRAHLAEVRAPILAIAGSLDTVTPPDLLRLLADGVPSGTFWVIDDVGHLAPAEAPDAVARLIIKHLLGVGRGPRPDEIRAHERFHAGQRMRQLVLGDHLDHTATQPTELTRDFEELTTEFVWGGIWSRPDLDRRSRSIISITAIIATGQQDELATQLRAARTNGLSISEICEIILHTAVYCGFPAARRALDTAQQVLVENR